jgi:hypothetical protein
MRVLISHEMGHVISGHSLYRTIAAILALISLGALPALAGIALLPVRLAFLEWSRKSELSSDRAGLLGSQDILSTQRLFMKLAGGGRGDQFVGQLNVDAFIAQANEYATTNEGLDIVYKVLATLAPDAPDAAPCALASCRRGWPRASTSASCAASTCAAAPRRASGRSARTSPRQAVTTPPGRANVASQVADAAKGVGDRVGEAFRQAQKS